MAPAWGGVLGGALTTAANAYLDTVLNEPYERMRKREAELKLERLEGQIALDKAHAAYWAGGGRPAGSRGPERLYKVPEGLFDRTTGQLVYRNLPGAPKSPKELEFLRQNIRGAMEEYVGMPLTDWTLEDYKRPELKPLLDIYFGKSDVIPTPGGATTRDAVRQAMPDGTVSPPQAPVPVQPVTPPSTATPPTVQPPPTAAPTTDLKPGYRENAYHQKYKTMTREEIQADLAEAYKRDPSRHSKDTAMREQAAGQVIASRNESAIVGTTSGPGAAPGAPPAAPTEPPAATVPGTPPGSQTGVAPSVITEGERRKRQLAEEEERRRQKDQTLQERQFEADRRGGKPAPRLAMIANALYLQGKVRPETQGLYDQFSPEERKMADDIFLQPQIAQELQRQALADKRQEDRARADRKEHLDAYKLAKDHFAELDALQATRELTEQIIPLVQTGNLGIPGYLQKAYQTWQQFVPGYQNKYEKLVDEQLRAKKINPKVELAARQAALIALTESQDPAVRAYFQKTAGQSMLQTLSSLLMYSHAMSLKRIGGGTARGIIKPDMEEAHGLFNPTLILSNPTQLLTNLHTLQGYIQKARGRIEDNIRAVHIDPKSRLLIKKDYTEYGAPEPAPGTLTPEQIELLEKQ